MKNLGIFCLLLTCFVIESCGKSQDQKDAEAAKLLEEKPVSTECYKAIYESDTIDLMINTLNNGKISGNMEMKILDMPIKIGKITGDFHGDTLLVDYSFYQGENDKKIFKNPMAFLKHEKELILGSGKIETYLGTSSFVKGEPIDFERVKYKFSSVDCVSK